MSRKWALTPLIAAMLLQLGGAWAQEPPAARELYRVRITNQSGGSVEASSDSGKTWETLGKVVRPATGVSLSTAVISVAPPGCVAGVTPAQVLIRMPAGKGLYRSLRIAAAGEEASSAVIATDIAPRTALFRTIAPPVGSRFLLEQEGAAVPLPSQYVPKPGDRLLILVTDPGPGEPQTLTIENKPDGEVVLATTGSVPRVVARVKQPLRGIGRYAGTERAGRGALVSWSPTAVLVSSSGRGRRGEDKEKAPEERGGFVIQPAEPTLQGSTHPASQLLLQAVAPAGPRALPAGTAPEEAPPVSSFFGLPAGLSSGDALDPRPAYVQIRIDGGDWESLPDLRGTIDEGGLAKALQSALGGARTVKSGISHLRVVFGGATPASIRRRIRLAATPAAGAPQKGVVTISANVMGEGISYVAFYLNGSLAQLTNRPPYSWVWDTTKEPNGEHLVEIRGLDEKTVVVTAVTTKVIVDN